jgi:hypothetical protein
LKRKDCGKVEDIGEFSSVGLYETEMVLEEEEEEEEEEGGGGWWCSYVTLESARVDET